MGCGEVSKGWHVPWGRGGTDDGLRIMGEPDMSAGPSLKDAGDVSH